MPSDHHSFPIIACCIVLIPVALFFECGANWDYYTDIDGILSPIAISWSILSVLILLIPLIVIIILLQLSIIPLKINQDDNCTELLQHLKYFLISVLLLLVILIVSLTLVMNNDFLDPNYVFDMKIFLYFIPAILSPFTILIYKSCMYHRNIYNIQHQFIYTLLNDIIFILFQFKLLSLFLITFIVSAAITITTFSTPLVIIYVFVSNIIIIILWITIGKLSTQLYTSYENYASNNTNTSKYIRPLIPYASTQGTEISLSPIVNSLADLTTGDDKMKGCCTYLILLYSRHTFWFRHSLLIITCLLTIITAYIKYQLENDTNVQRYALTTIIAAALPIILSIYSVVTEYNNEFCKCRKQSHCLSSDVKYRGIIFTKTLLFMLKNYLIEFSGPDLLGYSFAVLSFSTLLFIAIMTWAVKSRVLKKLPVKNPNIFRITYLISYIICKISSFFVVVNSFINCTYIPCTSFIGNVVLPFLWIFWSKLYNNEVARFTSELRRTNAVNNGIISYDHDATKNVNKICGRSIIIESFPSTIGSLYQLQCMIIIGSFMTLLICLFNIYEIFIGGNKVGIDLEARITLFFHIFFALIAFVNAIVAKNSIQPRLNMKDKETTFRTKLDRKYLCFQGDQDTIDLTVPLTDYH